MQGIDPELALRIVRTVPEIAYDTETSGLDPTIDFICGYVVTDRDNSVYVPVRHEAGGNIPDVAEFEAALADAFRERTRLGYRTIGHHLGFDLRFSLKHGIVITNCEDTMTNEGMIDDRTVGYGLDDLSRRYQVTVKKGDELYRAIAARFGGIPDRKQMANYWRMPGDQFEVWDYAVGDGVSTLEVWEKQQVLLDREELRVPWQLECDLLPYVARVWQRGIRIDMGYGDEATKNLEQQIAANKSVFPPGFNSRAPSEVEKLYRTNGYDDSRFARTAQGKVSFTEKWLETNDIGKAILDIRRLEKARDAFIQPLVATNNRNGRVHPTLNQSKSDEFGVAGARFSCSAPNLQAYPKRNKVVGKIVRPLVIPDDGMELGEGDAMQQEPRFFAHYSEDPALMEGYKDPNFSMHRRANDLMFGGDEEMYDTAKRMSMGILSMMFPKTLALNLDIDVETAKRYRNKYLYDAFPLVGKFQNDVMSVFERRGYVRSILGRRARFESSRFAYQGVSRVIQNSGGDHNKTCFLRACQFEEAHPEVVQILLAIHDSIVWQNDPGRRDKVKELIAILENVPHEPQFNLKVPIPFEVGLGANWAITSYGDKAKGKNGWVV